MKQESKLQFHRNLEIFPALAKCRLILTMAKILCVLAATIIVQPAPVARLINVWVVTHDRFSLIAYANVQKDSMMMVLLMSVNVK